VSPGSTVTDTVTLSGLVKNSNVTYSVSGTLVSVSLLSDGSCPAASAAAWKSAKTILSVPDTAVTSSAIQSDGTATMSKLGSWTVPADAVTQCISYGETVVMKVTGQADTTVNHPAGQTPQTGLVVASPTITTNISAQVVAPGSTVSDTVTLGGLVKNSSVSYSVSGTLVTTPMLDDGTCPAASAAAWKTAKTVLSVPKTTVASSAIKTDGTATLTKLGSWVVPLDVTTQCISYGETVTMTVTGQTDVTVSHAAGLVPQTGLVVAAPKIETTVSNQAVVPGTTVSDRVTLGGLVSNKNVTYTISGTLVSTPPLVDGTCPNIADAVWGDAITTLLEIPETTLPADAIEKDGTATLDPFGEWVVPLDAPTQCISYGEDLFMKITGQPTIKVEHPAGSTPQTGLVTKIEIQATGIEVQAGGQVTSPAGFGLWGVAGCLLTAGIGGGVMILRRRHITG